MSRIGKRPVPIPSGVDVAVDGTTVTVRGPKGTLSRTFHPKMKIRLEAGQVVVERPNDEPAMRALHGTTRSLIANMIQGVTEGYVRALEIVGVGYRAQKQGKKLVIALGYSHPVEYEPEDGIEIDVPEPTKIIVRGIDKEKVGLVAAKIRSFREPEPYKGKGIRYAGEVVRQKVGKAGAKKK
ncbi:50S ribosomal protein L6 [Hydrogenibacillus schlegelii]|uniref:Large ribosomal subunit protein uL6 n=1 Tax=Hydrogenibacillus schlegelii TaxID=1484 RepID=A0A132N4T7_HYDSH|nr:50S ribosomal protein L6 [Hydrogenibacillus schlegelii]KWX04602.1 50S ribosomal protein L6 [Hydrogenibacillus schlegelii]OAR04440.1 50S ribosomal protein L6 [Hydrogenibacillus schlegelii]